MSEPPRDRDAKPGAPASGDSEVQGAVPAEPTKAAVDVAEAEAEVAPLPLATVVSSPDSLVPPPMVFPDDGPAARSLRQVDHWVGMGEQLALFVMLVIMVVVGSGHVILEKLFHTGFWFIEDVIRGGTFFIATVGAAFATQQQRHLAMDLLSRQFTPRGRLVLATLLEAFTIVIALVIARSGWRMIGASGNWTGRHLFELRNVIFCLPLGGVLIAFHAALHLVIDIDYLVRGKLPPERARSAH